MTANCRVVPAILTEDPQALRNMLAQSATFTDYVQVDFMDGHFVPSTSISTKQLPEFPRGLNWEAHIMVIKPESYLGGLRKAGANRIIYHYEATSSHEKFIVKARDMKLEVGLAVNPETPVSAFLPLISSIDSVLFLTVNPGFYGSKFIPEVLDKITELRKLNMHLEIGVDGGIKENNISEVARRGVDYICVGSAIFLQPDPAASFNRLRELVKQSS